MKTRDTLREGLIKRILATVAVLIVCGLLLEAQRRWHFASVDPMVFPMWIALALLYIGGPRFRAWPILVHLAIWALLVIMTLLILGARWWVAVVYPTVIFLLIVRGEWDKMVHGGRAPKIARRNDGESRSSASLGESHQSATLRPSTRGQTFLRVLRHSLIAPWRARSWRSDTLQSAIRDRISASEQNHLGEIVVAIETRWSTDDIRRDMTSAQHARNRFSELGVWNTEHNNGVLIHISVAERAIDLIADRGIAERVDASTWQVIANELAAQCKRGAIQSGLLAAIDRVGTLLNEHYPTSASDENPDERSNIPVLT